MGAHRTMDRARILVVEDEAIVAEDIRLTLESFGYDVCGVVPAGEDALAQVEKEPPDLVLMDIMLQGEMDGVEAAEIIRTRFQVPVVYLTAYADERTLERAKVTEPFGYIIKPFEERELRIVIEMALYKARMERELRAREEWFSTTLKSIGDAVIATDAAGRVKFLNPVAEDLTGWTTDEAEGRAIDEVFHIVNERTRKPVENPVTKVLREGVVVGLGNHTLLISRDGREISIDDSGAPIRDAQGEIVGVVLVFRDISEKRALQARLEMAQRMEAIGTLAGGIAHDFNNLLQGLRGYVSLMLNDMDPEHPHYKKLRNMEMQIENGARLTSQLLGFARGGKYHVEPCDINRIVRKNLELFRETHKEIEVTAEYSMDLCQAEVDQGQIDQVMMNLCVNAWQAMPGGGSLSVETANEEIGGERAGLLQVEPGMYIRISVRDSGVGMDRETLERVFEPFFTTKELGQGTGLGLASAYGIIRNHGGTIEVESRPGEGSVFHVYLPATDKASPGAAGPAAPAGLLERGHGTILLVDDEKVLLEVGKEMLNVMGYNVLSASNGVDALRVFDAHKERIDLVILDMIMPRLGGGDVYRRIKRIKPGIKVLFSSGYAMSNDTKKLIERGRSDFIQKPFSMHELSEKLKALGL